MGKLTSLQRWERQVVKGDAAECWLWSGGLNHRGYGLATVWVDGRYSTVRAHRLAYELFVGPIPDGKLIDHVCHSRSCVNPAHLRVVTNKQNEENRAGLNDNNTSGYRGVHQARGKWEARVKHNGKTRWAGYFATAEEANEAAIALRNERFTHNDADRAA